MPALPPCQTMHENPERGLSCGESSMLLLIFHEIISCADQNICSSMFFNFQLYSISFQMYPLSTLFAFPPAVTLGRSKTLHLCSTLTFTKLPFCNNIYFSWYFTLHYFHHLQTCLNISTLYCMRSILSVFGQSFLYVKSSHTTSLWSSIK